MRWFWIDRFVEFERGKRAVAIKNVSIAEEHLHSQANSWPSMPHSLIIEGMAQTGGILVGEYGHFEERVVLAKVGKAEFAFPVFPGDTLTTAIWRTGEGQAVFRTEAANPDGSDARLVLEDGVAEYAG